MIVSNIRLAFDSIRRARMRSFLTMLGIIIGVASVMVTVSLGEGVKQQVSAQLNNFGADLITVRPGRQYSRDSNSLNPAAILFNNSTGQLTDADVQTVSNAQNVRISSPLSAVNGIPQYEDRRYDEGLVIGVSASLPDLLNHKVEFGAFYGIGEETRNVAVLGSEAAQKLFQENVPVGKTFTLRGQEFIVRGIFEEFESNPLSPGGDYNKAVFIPYEAAKTITSGTTQVFEVLAKPSSPDQLGAAHDSIRAGLLQAHGEQEDFTVLSQDEAKSDRNDVLTLLTTMVAGIAGISLLVGGIGIMNIMLVSVTERMHEIGIRKAIGATNRQILGQFVVEAAVLSFTGSLLGVVLAFIANFLLRSFTDLKPIINVPTALLAVGVAIIVGTFFGAAPAIKAARKDPIDALRYE